jgi:dephospho-CoA kinase
VTLRARLTAPPALRRQWARRALRVLGLTGGIGSGKSTVLALFRRHGARTVDADRLVRETTAPRGEAFRRVVGLFGGDILSPSGQLDKTAVARKIFREPALRRRLEKIVHPIVIRRLKAEIRKTKRGILVMDVPLLYEVGLDRLADAVVCVWAPMDARLRRLRRKGRFFEADIRRRIKAQMPLERKCRRADFVVDNGGSLAHTRRQVAELWQGLVSSPRAERERGRRAVRFSR